jgi:hypothetical protein
LLGLTNAKTSGLILGNDDQIISTEEHELGASDLDSSGREVRPSRGNGGDLLQKRKCRHKWDVSMWAIEKGDGSTRRMKSEKSC